LALGAALVFQIIAVVGLFGLGETGEGFVLGPLESLDLGLTVRPGVKDPRMFALPDHIELFPFGHQLRSFSMIFGKCSYSNRCTLSATLWASSEGPIGVWAWKMMAPPS